jgi:hypothetical protein
MMGRTHVLWAGALWLAAAPVILELDALELAASTVVAMGCGVLPDIDCPRSRDLRTGHVKHGATPAEAHGPASRWVARAVHDLAGGHRHATHWALTCAAAGLAVVPAMWAAPRLAVGLVVGIVAAWPIRLLAHGRGRRSAPAAAGALGLAAAMLAPAGWWLPLAVGAGALAHVAGDWLCRTRGGGVPVLGPFTRRRFEAGLFEIDGPVEHGVEWALHLGIGVLWWWRLAATLPGLWSRLQGVLPPTLQR